MRHVVVFVLCLASVGIWFVVLHSVRQLKMARRRSLTDLTENRMVYTDFKRIRPAG